MSKPELKTCLACEQILSIDAFALDGARKDGRCWQCKNCQCAVNSVRAIKYSHEQYIALPTEQQRLLVECRCRLAACTTAWWQHGSSATDFCSAQCRASYFAPVDGFKHCSKCDICKAFA